jgi:hypothetical protein
MRGEGKQEAQNKNAEKDTRTRVCVIRPPKDLQEEFGINLLTFGQSVEDLIDSGKSAANGRLNTLADTGNLLAD